VHDGYDTIRIGLRVELVLKPEHTKRGVASKACGERARTAGQTVHGYLHLCDVHCNDVSSKRQAVSLTVENCYTFLPP